MYHSWACPNMVQVLCKSLKITLEIYLHPRKLQKGVLPFSCTQYLILQAMGGELMAVISELKLSKFSVVMNDPIS